MESNTGRGINISPRISNNAGKFPFSFKGIDLIVLALVVTSSPCTPSPRVIACFKMPFSYIKLMDKPSNFNSQTYSIGSLNNPFEMMPNPSRTFLSKSIKSSWL